MNPSHKQHDMQIITSKAFIVDRLATNIYENTMLTQLPNKHLRLDINNFIMNDDNNSADNTVVFI